MPKHGKKFQKAAGIVPTRENPLDDPSAALELVKSASFAKFDESVEIAVRLGVDPRRHRSGRGLLGQCKSGQ